MNINNVNNTTAFQAKLVMNVKTNQPKRIKNIAEIFKKETENDKNTIMSYYVDNNDGIRSEGVRISDSILLFDNTIKNMLATLSDSEIANKLKKAFLCLRREQLCDQEQRQIDSDIRKVTGLIEHYTNKSNALNESGHNKFANVYNVVVGRNHEKLKSLEAEKEKGYNRFLSYITDVIDNDKDFNSYIDATSK